MKALPLLFAASLVANVALVTVALRHPSDESPESRATSTTPARSADDTRVATHSDNPLSAELVTVLKGNNLQALGDQLRAAGVPEDVIRSIISSRIWKKYEARMNALNSQSDPNRPWWKDDRANAQARNEEYRKLRREINEEIERVLGPDPNSTRSATNPRLSFLPPTKVKALQDIQADYQELMSEINRDAQGFRLASDTEKLRFLQEEQRRDIEALLSPEELLAYDMRMSPTAQRLRRQMTELDVSEPEYRTIFSIQKSFDDQFNQPNDPSRPRDQAYWRERNAAEKQLKEQIKSVVGEQRYAEWVRGQDNDWRQLELATRRLELPPDTPTRLFSLRDTVANEVQQIANNPSLDFNAKKKALSEVAARTRDQVRSTLGAEGAETYFKNQGMNWLRELDRGNPVKFRADAPGWDRSQLPPPPKPRAKK